MSTWRARTIDSGNDFARDRVCLLLAEDTDNGRRILKPVPMIMDVPHDPLVASAEPYEPSLSMPTDAAFALFEALATHFLGTSDVGNLRRQLEAERARVDKLIAGIGHLGGQS